MKLYRVIGIEELYKILKGETVYGRFDQETPDTDYKKEYGPVVCCFVNPVHPSPWDSFIIELNVNKSQIKGQGISRWVQEDGYDNRYVYYEPEVYITHYTPSQVVGIYPLWHDTVLDEFMTCFWTMRESIDELLFMRKVGILSDEENMLLDIYMLLSKGNPKLKRKQDINATLFKNGQYIGKSIEWNMW